jgi:hypothetical protein
MAIISQFWRIWHRGRVGVIWSFRLGMLCVPCCSALSRCRSVTIFYLASRLQRPSQNRTCRFPTSGSSTALTSNVRKRRSIEGERVVGRIRFRARDRSTFALTRCCQPLRVGRIARAGRYSGYASTMSWSDCRCRRTSALPLRLVGGLRQDCSRRSGTALPSSTMNR